MNKRIRVHFSAGVKYNDVYYLTAIHMNALFMYDEKKDKLTFLTSFQKEKKSEYLYLKAFLYKNEAWFIPYQAENIAIVNLDTYSVQYMPLDYQKCYDYEGIKYINILPFNDNFLCLIPWDVDTMMIVDLQNKKSKAYYDIVVQKRNYQTAIFLNNKIYFFPWKANNILVLDLETNERTKLPWLEKEESFGDVVYDKKTGHLFHAPAKQNYILIDNLNNKVCRKIALDYWKDEEYKTYYSTEAIDDIFFWGQEKNVVLKINKCDCSIKVYPITPQFSQKYFYPIYSDTIEALVYDGSCIIKYNIEKDEFSYLYISTTINELMQEMKMQGLNFIKTQEENNFHENEVWNLMNFLFYTSDDSKIRDNKLKESVGYQIYNHI